MQEKLTLRKTLKKVAAVGTSLAMVGITISGALAAGLNDYPSTLGFKNTVGDTLVVYGADADNAAAMNVLAGLPGAATTTTTTAKGSWNDLTLDTASGFTKEVTLGTLLGSTTAFGTAVRESRIKGFKTGSLPISISTTSSSPKYHEQVNFRADAAGGCYVTTGLALANVNSSSDSFGSNPILYGPNGCMDFQVKFDDALTAGNQFGNATATNPIELPLLGEYALVEGATASNQITSVVGKQFVMAVNDVVTYDGHTFSLSTVGSTSIALTSDACAGQSVLISTNNQRNCGNYVIRATDITGGGTAISGTPSAKVTIGKASQGGALRTSTSGDYYIAQDKNNPFWTWKLQGLFDTAAVAVNVSVQMGKSLTSSNGPSSPDYLLGKHLPTVGDKLCWPNNYVCLSLDKMTQNTDEFGQYRVSIDSQDLYGSTTATTTTYSGAKVIKIEALNGGSGLGLQDEAGTDTDTLAIWLNGSGLGSTYRKDVTTNHFVNRLWTINASATVPGVTGDNIVSTPHHGTPSTLIGYVNYKSTNFPIYANLWYAGAGASWMSTQANGTLLFSPTSTGNFSLFLKGDASGNSNFLGTAQGGSTYAYDVAYIAAPPAVDLSDYKNDAMTKDGVVIKSYANSRGSDEFYFNVPPDVTNYKSVLTLAQPTGLGTAGATIISSVLVKDTDLTGKDLTQYNLVVVGGPCVNQVAANILTNGVKTCDTASGLVAGEAELVLKANGASKKALLVYGWEKDDTARAAVLLKDPSVLAQKLTDAGKTGADQVRVLGTTLDVTGITVA